MVWLHRSYILHEFQGILYNTLLTPIVGQLSVFAQVSDSMVHVIRNLGSLSLKIPRNPRPAENSNIPSREAAVFQQGFG